MADIGQIALLLGLIIAACAVLASLFGLAGKSRRLLTSARVAVYAVAGLLSLAALALLWSLVMRDFGVAYVSQHTSADLSLGYTISAFWSGPEGSLLFWAWLMSLAATIAVWQAGRKHAQLQPYITATLMCIQGFLLLALMITGDVFARLDSLPVDGVGLNPLLQNPWMVVHPPAVFLGYVGFAVPFAYAIAVLANGDRERDWILTARNWALLSWVFLGIGNILGAQWAYVELSFGGFWAWDPVENGSLLPWLTGTALLHSMVVQRQRGWFKAWTMVLIVVTFSLCLIGAFLVRSGIVNSVHAFTPSSIGMVFALFIALVIIVSIALLVRRLPMMRSEQAAPSLLSKENSFALTNYLFLALSVVILWGTIFPAVSEAFIGRQAVLGSAFFNQMAPPFFTAILVLMGVCPLIKWRNQSLEVLAQRVMLPVALVLVFAVAMFALGVRQPWALLAFSICALIVASTVTDWVAAGLARRRTSGERLARALATLTWQGRRRYGGYIVHLGVALIALGIAGSSLYHWEANVNLARGETASVAGYEFKYEEMSEFESANAIGKAATLSVYQDNGFVDRLTTEKVFHRNFEQPQTLIGLRMMPFEDLYVVLNGWQNDGETASFLLMVNGYMVWLWIGAVGLVAGSVLAFWPERRRERVSVASQLEYQSAEQEGGGGI
jgi:cytochrome c-type biogenesis protein CcmF